MPIYNVTRSRKRDQFNQIPKKKKLLVGSYKQALFLLLTMQHFPIVHTSLKVHLTENIEERFMHNNECVLSKVSAAEVF